MHIEPGNFEGVLYVPMTSEEVRLLPARWSLGLRLEGLGLRV